MSTVATLILGAAARVGAPLLSSLLRNKVGGVVGDVGGTIIDAVARKAGVDVPDLEKLPQKQLDDAVYQVEADAPALLDQYLAAQQEANRLMLAEMEKGKGFGWLWRPAGMWLMLLCILWYIIVLPLLSGYASFPIVPAVPFGDFVTVFITFVGFYMGGHTAKAVWKK
jgi:hypothetical protein